MKQNTFIAVRHTGENYDVFWNSGWENWSRVSVNNETKQVTHLKGIKMPFYIKAALIKYLRLE